MGTPIDFRRIFSSDGAIGKHGHGQPAQHDFLGIAAYYLNVATEEENLSDDEQLSHDEELVYEALEDIPLKAQTTPAAAALSRYLSNAQTSSGKLTHQERQFAVKLAGCLKENPRGDTPGLEALLNLINNLVTHGKTAKALTTPERHVVQMLLKMVRSGDIAGPAIEKLISLARHLARSGASQSDGRYSGLDAADVATIKEQIAEAQDTHPGPSSHRHTSNSANPKGDHSAHASEASPMRQAAPDADPQATTGTDSTAEASPEKDHAAHPEATEPDPRQTLKHELGDAVDPAWVDKLSSHQVQALLQLDAPVAQVLLKAGMKLPDVLRLAPTLSDEEVTKASFADALSERLQKGDSADDALLRSRYEGLADDAELCRPKFRADITEARRLHPEHSLKQHIHYARALALYRQLGSAVPLGTLLKQPPQVIEHLLAMDPSVATALAQKGIDLAAIAAATPEQIPSLLLTANAEVVKALKGAGMREADVAACAQTVSLEEAQSPGFIQVVQNKLAANTPAADAIVCARFSAYASPQELSDPQFIQDLSGAAAKGHGETPLSSVFYARGNLLVRHLDNTVPLKEVLRLDSASVQGLLAADPAQIKQLLGLGMNLGQFAKLTPTQRSNLLAANPDVVKGLVGAGMSAADVAAYAGTIKPNEIKAPAFLQLLRDKLSAGLPAADAIVCVRFSGAATAGELKDPQFIQDLKDAGANGHGALPADSLQFARASRSARTLGIQPTEILALQPEQLTQLLSLDANALKPYLAQGRSLAELATLTPAGLANLEKINPTLRQWVFQNTQASLADASKLADADIATLQSAMDNGSRLATPDEAFNDIKPETVSHPISLGSGVLSFETQSGQKIIVIKDTNPSLYNQALGLLTDRSQTQIDETRAQTGLPPEAEVNVMKLPTNVPSNPDDASAGNLAVGPNTLQVLLDRYRGYILQPGQATVENNLVTYRLADGSELKVDKNQLKTDRAKAIFDNLIAGKAVSEEELKYLESEEGSADIFEGNDWDTWIKFTQHIPKDDPRAQLVRALEARNALANGYSLLPYYEEDAGFGNTQRTYPGGENNPTYQTATPADLRAVLNEGAVNNRVVSLMANESIQDDYQVAVTESVNTLPNKQELSDKLYNALTGPQYIDALRALKDKGLSYEAQQMTQRDLAQLALLDPARAVDAAQQLRLNSLSADFQDLTNDPSKIDNATFETATTDALIIVAGILRNAIGGVRHGAQSAIDTVKFIEETLKDKKSVAELSKVLRELVIEAKTGAGGQVDLKGITQAQFDRAMSKTYVPPEMRGKLTGFFTKAQTFGVWGTLSGAAAVASFGYQISKGAWSADSTPKERWGAARDLIAFVSVGQHVAKTGAGAADFLLNKLLGTDGESQRVWKALGLDRTLPELWGKTSFLPSQTAAPNPLKQPLLADDAFGHSANDFWNEYDNPVERAAKLPQNAGTQALDAADHLGNIWATESELKPMGNIASRVGLSAFKTLSSVVDLVGVGDIVFGALGLKNAINEGDSGMIAAHSMGIAGGVALTGAGVIGTAGLFSVVPAAIALASAPLFLAGTVLAAGGFIISLIVGDIKRHNELQRNSDEQGQWFQDLANDGLAAGDWADKLEYLRYSYAWYGNDNTDPNRSYFEFQQAEWNDFHSTPKEGGSSMGRLNNDLHVHTDKTTLAPPEQAYLATEGQQGS